MPSDAVAISVESQLFFVFLEGCVPNWNALQGQGAPTVHSWRENWIHAFLM